MSDPVVDPAESSAAVAAFCQLLDPERINAAQPMGPATVYTPWVVLWLMIYQRLHQNATLAEAVAELVRNPDWLPRNRRVSERTLSANTTTYSQARTRLRADIPESVADHVFDTLLAQTPPSFANRRVLILDGTTVTLTPTPELVAAFPPATNGKGTSVWPVWYWVVAHELASGCAIRPETGPMYGPDALSELTLATRLVKRLPARSVLLADRNFGVFAFAYAAQQAGHDVVTRLTQKRFLAWVKSARAVGSGVWKLDWRPSRWDRKAHPHLPADAWIRVRLHEVAIGGGKVLWLASTVDADSASLAALYRLRQDVETDIRNVKKTLATDQFRGKSVDMVQKELSSSVISYNLVVQVRRLAAARAGVSPRRLSFAGVWNLVKVVLLSPNEWLLGEWEQKFDWVLRGAAQRRVPNRPDRSYPRTVLRRQRTFPNRPRTTPPTPPNDTK